MKNKNDVNQYLLAKYTDSQVEAIINGYDQSPQRYEHSITFDYHVFFNKKVDRNGNDIYEELRPPAQYIKTKRSFLLKEILTFIIFLLDSI
jgi:hypothetical protein